MAKGGVRSAILSGYKPDFQKNESQPEQWPAIGYKRREWLAFL